MVKFRIKIAVKHAEIIQAMPNAHTVNWQMGTLRWQIYGM